MADRTFLGIVGCLTAITVTVVSCTDEQYGCETCRHEGQQLSRLTVRAGPERAIYDALGRQVLLRGVNFNHLGDYWQVHPLLPTVANLGPDDWDDVAALGHNVVRLVTSWSFWQPQRNEIDLRYLAWVKEAVAAANERGLYVVIDMHQDAWSKYIFTPAEQPCSEGTWHQKGWDGAPLWATITDSEPTCNPGRREDSPAVIRAWDHFYANTDGIRDELAALWGFIAREFVDNDGVAGYDLLNEPGMGSNVLSTISGLTEFYRAAITAIRVAEADSSNVPGHLIFFEPTVIGLPPALEVDDDNIVFAPHNYAESIGPAFKGLLDLSFLYFDLLGKSYGMPVWTGEYNRFSNPDTNEAWTTRFAEREDHYLFSGGAWWQWEQECGDPHNVQYPASQEWLEQQRQRCGKARMRVSACLWRAYPRATPGTLISLSATPCGQDKSLHLSGRCPQASVAEIWYPSSSDARPEVNGIGIEEASFRRVPGGWQIRAVVEGDYEIVVTRH